MLRSHLKCFKNSEDITRQLVNRLVIFILLKYMKLSVNNFIWLMIIRKHFLFFFLLFGVLYKSTVTVVVEILFFILSHH